MTPLLESLPEFRAGIHLHSGLSSGRALYTGPLYQTLNRELDAVLRQHVGLIRVSRSIRVCHAEQSAVQQGFDVCPANGGPVIHA